MLVDFDSLSDTARVWIYQCNRALTEGELSEIEADIKEYLSGWVSHRSLIRSAFELRYGRFIIIAADDSQHIGGCSQDDLARFIQTLEQRYHILLLDKMNVTYRHEGEIYYVPLTDFKKLAQQKKISQETIVFNNLVNNKYEYEHSWETTVLNSWHSRFLK